MGNTTGSAKVTFSEVDASYFMAQVINNRNCIAVTARKGPINQPVIVGSMQKYREVFGLSIPSANSDQICQRALDRGSVLYVARVVHYTDPSDPLSITAETAELTLKNASAVDTIKLVAANAGTWGNTLLITISVNGADSARFDISIVFPEQPELNETYKALTMDNQDDRYAVAFINGNSKLIEAEDLESGDPFVGDTVTVDGSAFIAGTDFPVNLDDIASMAADLASDIDALATVGAVAVNNVITVTASTPGPGGNALTLAVTSAGNNITKSGNTLTGGANAVAATGTVTYGAPSNGDKITIDGTEFTKAAAPSATEFSTIAELTALIAALANVNANDNGAVITITAAAAGPAGNAIAMTKTGAALTLSGATLTGGAAAVAATGTITIDLTPTVIDNPAVVGPIAMSGGVDGLVGLDDDDWIGDTVVGNGIHAFDDINDAMLLGVPENPSPTMIAAGLAYCEGRADMVYICEPGPDVLDADEAVAFRKGTAPYNHAAFNSSFGAMQFGRPKVRSNKTNSIIDISTIGDTIGVHAYSDAKAEPWYAAAGLQRGKIPNTLGVHYNVGTPARKAELDNLSNNQINAIVDFPDFGTTLWDNLTLQSLPSATQSLNIRKLLIYMRRALTIVSQIMLFEPNDPVTWRAIYNLIDPFMVQLKARRGFYDFKVMCDQDAKTIDQAILNTPEKIDQGIFTCRIFIKPTRALKFLGIEAIITKSDANFNELYDVEQF